MEATELRIGNLFIEYHSRKIIKVIGLEEKRIVFSGLFLDKWQAKPIPLTKEILLKCGFYRITGDLYTNDIIDIRVGKFIEIHKNRNIINNKDLFLYLHQLQNLYFALSGEELTINL